MWFPGSLTAQRAAHQIQLVRAARAQSEVVHPRAASVHVQASTAHVLNTELPRLGALPVGNLGGLLPAVSTQRHTTREVVTVHRSTVREPAPTTTLTDRSAAPKTTSVARAIAPITTTTARPAPPITTTTARPAPPTTTTTQAPRTYSPPPRQGTAQTTTTNQQASAGAKNQQQIEAYWRAVAAAKRQQQIEAYWRAVAAARRARVVTSVPAVPIRPVTRSAFHNGPVTPAGQESLPPPVPATGQGGLPLPIQYLQNGTVDQGVDYAAPGGTPLFAMGPGTVIGAGISGFGPNAPILQIASGPLAGRTVYYGHAGPNVVPVGARVAQGQQISIVGYGIVGISTGPHLEVGFYPPGPMGSGQAMLDYINRVVGHNTGA